MTGHRRDRWGEEVEDDEPDDAESESAHNSACVGGWLPDDDNGRAVACPRCRPWVYESRLRLRRTLEGPRP
jgi:hypothetical protein